MTARELQLLFYRTQHTRYDDLIPNAYAKNWAECDILCIRPSGFVDEIEIKVSRSDFKADFNKTVWMSGEGDVNKHLLLQQQRSPINYFWFMMPENLMALDEIPEYAGVLYAMIRRDQLFLKTARQPKRLHKNKCDLDFRYHASRKIQYRYWDQLRVMS